MAASVEDIKRPTCEYEDCPNYATKKVNYRSFTDYMAVNVCARHVQWAQKELKQYLPDR